ncbi:serine/threonine protein kinase [Capronia coronata CBS 617.96]|uniref:Serine/threonine protein kinase n=1 Tax=Capronia coronata CBS 617.96 TaxID=1182541 RepID=W9YNN3_9EURO|nr:serine/threonine protein kinase [Capronia coronata CBS 617.96]EXJ83849.1 serine/threonine protein kinase [Capronia coronata CBS 617.96]
MECMKDRFRKDELLDGRFRTIAPLNHGSFGMVFLAEDTRTGEEVAIKCLTKPSVAAHTNSVSSADEGAEELACHAILKYHDHLVNLIHHFETKAHTYLVLEYCSQGDLYEAIRLGHGPLQTEHVRRFMLQLISAVHHMHINGLFHRDIKPENIFLTNDGSLKLGDFGLATRSLWSYEPCVGSDRYMAPEQYDPAGNGYSPAKADIWSIGICLLNVLFAKNPFVTPTESDVLFADYVRDRQSLFDIFPGMSQDTFEILSIAMALDPAKRDLGALKQAVLRAVTFTTDDDSFDEFCAEERDVVRASANREPLRTPSLQSPHMDGESFPWAKALHSSPQRKQQQLASIPDMYEEDLFASEKSLKLGESWFSGHNNTPSLSSVYDSAYGSYKSMAIKRPSLRHPPQADPVPIPHSLPSRPSRPIPTMSSVFGKKDDFVAKSWSDMFEEDEEELERESALDLRGDRASRGWSHESNKRHLPVPPGVLTESKSRSSSNAFRSHTPKPTSPTKLGHAANENDPFAGRDRTPRHSPKQMPVDKWAALGNRRRNPQAETGPQSWSTKKRSFTTGSRKRPTSMIGFDQQASQRRDSRSKARPAYLNQDWRSARAIDTSSADEDDHEWVGGWHNFHL